MEALILAVVLPLLVYAWVTPTTATGARRLYAEVVCSLTVLAVVAGIIIGLFALWMELGGCAGQWDWKNVAGAQCS